MCISDHSDGGKKDANMDAGGQMNLFATPQTKEFLGMAVCFGEEDTYFSGQAKN